MEKLLHYLWKHRILPLTALHTTDGREVEIIDVGMHNSNQGPDFFNAKIKLDGTLWAGSVEIHLKSSDWFRHGHEQDARYNNTVLHVVENADCEVVTEDGSHPAQLQMAIPPKISMHYQELCETDDYPRCHRMIPSLDVMKVHGWMDALLAERLTERAEKIRERVESTQGDWEQATFVTLARNFGFGLNGDAFERWAKRIPLMAVGKHRDNLFQIKAIFLGMAGLIGEIGSDNGEEAELKMQQEFNYLRHKFQLPEPMLAEDWKYMRTRPQNFPHIRILQLARLYQSGQAQMSALLEAKDVKALQKALTTEGTSRLSRNLIIVNTVAPLLYAYGMHLHEQELMEQAIELLQQLPAENNYILRQWEACGLKVKHAADSQALIQLKSKYCDRHDCLRCRFGYEYLKKAEWE